MQNGVEMILRALPEYITLPRPVALFDVESYYAALPHIRRNTICIVFCGEQPCLFLPHKPVLYRVSRNITPVNLKDIIITLADDRPLTKPSAVPFNLDETEKAFITLFIAGSNPKKTSHILGLHVKTIYIIRHRIMNKFSCRTVPEFSMLCNLPLFRRWFSPPESTL